MRSSQGQEKGWGATGRRLPKKERLRFSLFLPLRTTMCSKFASHNPTVLHVAHSLQLKL